MISREKLIEAAARVYAEAGFRGATTRRIAEEAGVNEVTIFRLFGSKAALIAQAVSEHARPAFDSCPLPDEPVDAAAELNAWAANHLAQLRAMRSLIRKTMGELEERPDAMPCVSAGPTERALRLRRYVTRLAERGMLGEPVVRGARKSVRLEELYGAGAMLMGSLFADAMGRDMMPEMFPQPAERASTVYVTLFLRAIGYVGTPVTPARRKSVGSTAPSGARHVLGAAASAGSARRVTGATRKPRPVTRSTSPSTSSRS